MFLSHYHLEEQPFGVTPDPRLLYLGPQHREALASLIYGTESNRGFLAMIAEPGMGKTSLLYSYLSILQTTARTAFVFRTDCDSREFIRHVLLDLDIDVAGMDLPAMHDTLNRILTEEMQAGRRFILVIDEAQNLDEKTLESIRLLSNFETPCSKLMLIILAGQPQLANRLASPSLAQLRQRISMVIPIKPLRPEEVNAYINHRLWVAGRRQPSLFTDEARQVIAEYSRGIPRNINNLCFNAMSLGCALGRETIDGDIVREAIRDLDLEPLMEKKVAAKISEKGPAREAPVRSYPRNEKSTSTSSSISSGWARRLAVGAILFLTMSGSAGQVNREEARPLEAPPDPSAQISPPLTPVLAGTADSASARIEPAADSVKSGETLRSNEVEGAVTGRGEIPGEDRGPNGLHSDPSRVQPDGSPGKTTRDATERGSGTRVAGIQNQ
jgi:type II secretory pathway predicted ATPase ExeA